jgi:hypothetical protein
MQVLYNVKQHQAYSRREINDKQLKLLSVQLEKGGTNQKYIQEMKAINDYVKKKEVDDMLKDENKVKGLKKKEMEMTRTLDR